MTPNFKPDIVNIHLSQSNWAPIFKNLCWINTSNTCPVNISEIPCTLMDFLLSLRHYHPHQGLSSWGESGSLIDSSTAQVTHHKSLGYVGLSTLGLIVLISIIIILYKNQSGSNIVLSAFNVKNHILEIFKKPTKTTDDRFLFLEFLRVISMCWVILGHSHLYWATFKPFDMIARDFVAMTQELKNYLIFASVFGVDNFFYIAGFVGGFQLYTMFYNISLKSKSTPNRFVSFIFQHISLIATCIFQRYVRLMGVTLLLLFGYLALNYTEMSNPAGSRYLQATNLACTEEIIPILTLTNNIQNGEFVNECFGWTWYLSNDFQFFLLGIFFCAMAVCSMQFFYLYVSITLILSIAASVRTAYIYHLSVSVTGLVRAWKRAADFLDNKKTYFPIHPIMDYFYVKPWVRVGPYLIGLVLGVSVAQCKILSKQAHEKSIVSCPKSCDFSSVRQLPKRLLHSQSSSSTSSSYQLKSKSALTQPDLSYKKRQQKQCQTIMFNKSALPHWLQRIVYQKLVLISITLGVPSALLIYAHFASRTPELPLGQYFDSLVMGLQRPLWGVSLAGWTLLMIFWGSSSETKVLHIVHDICSCRIWLPVARLSFAIYLTHPNILFAFYGSGHGPTEFDSIALMNCYIFNVCVAICLAAVLFVAAERPQKILLDGVLSSFSKKQKSV